MTKTNLSGREIFIVDGSRTPFLRAKGKPGAFTASDLAVHASKHLIEHLPFEPENLDEVIVGCVMPGPDEANIARIIALRLGCSKQVPAWTVQRNCGSGMQSLDNAAQNIASGRADLILAGGTEAMSHAPLLLNRAMVNWMGDWYGAKDVKSKLKALSTLRPGYFAPVIALLRGLTDPVVGLSMGQTAENQVNEFNLSRAQLDEFSLRSHQRLAKAMDDGLMKEIMTIYDHMGNFYDHDTGLRRDTSLEKLAKIKPAFDKKFGSVTPGNSSQVTDGAAMLVLASEKAVKQYNLPVLARIVDVNWAGLDPAVMGYGPIHASTPILQRHKMDLSHIDYWEINEAFAGQVLACLEAWKDEAYCKEHFNMTKAMGEVDPDRLNINGGAICIGHPIGASGARVALHLANILKEKNAKRGIAALCIGGGQGGAMLIERV